MSDWEYTDIHRFMGRFCGGPEITLRQAVEGDISDVSRAAFDACVSSRLRGWDEANAKAKVILASWIDDEESRERHNAMMRRLYEQEQSSGSGWVEEDSEFTEEFWLDLAKYAANWEQRNAPPAPWISTPRLEE